jgi:hypothetical protein
MRVLRDPLFYFRPDSGAVAAIAAGPARQTQDGSVTADNCTGPAHRHLADTRIFETPWSF